MQQIATGPVIERLLNSNEPSVRWKTLVRVLGTDPDSPEVTAVQGEIRNSGRVRTLLSQRDESGRIDVPRGVYAKWQGGHWALSTLADIGYPAGDESLRPATDQLLDTWLGDEFFTEFEASSKANVYSRHAGGVPVMQGRYRRCASQQSNALWTILKLGQYSDRCDQLVERLLYWQWPDGGWNCDKDPDAHTSSLVETLFPLRGLALYERSFPSEQVRAAVQRASEVFLARRLFRRLSSGKIIRGEFNKLHYPLYWHYDFLGALKVMAESGFIDDPRCVDALDLLESRRLPDGGWPTDSKYYTVREEIKLGSDYVDWGSTSTRLMNEWVTADALSVRASAGRLAS
ncbi:MAG: hypothetical protein O3B95_12520 [Chloroflexi bacterium]|nr:hypothetical protein [Chloroflexota bacterium]